MNPTSEQIKQLLSDADHPLGVKELLRLAGLHPGQQTELKRTLREMVRGGQILKEGKRFRVEEPRHVSAASRPHGGPRGHEAPGQLEGVLHVHRDGYGFVHPLSGEGDNVFLPPSEAARALDNDRVLVEVMGRPGRLEGRLVRVMERRRQLVVGTYEERGGRHAAVVPLDASLQGPIRVPRTQMARDGDLVKVRLGVGSQILDAEEGLFGEVAGSLGKRGDPSAEVLSIAYGQGFNDEFPPEVMDEADRVGPAVSEEEARGESRKDLRALPLITIDGEDARDFDDAVYAEPQGNGWRLVVAIADVTHYVREGMALDAEALRRATSVYLPDRVLPMLPERLSNGICSLRPEEDRLCMVADMVFDARAHLRSYELYPGVMRSVARCTYNEVQAVLDGEDVPHRNHLRPQFERLLALSRALRKMRQGRGAIDFDLPEHKVVMGEEGQPERMEKRERKESHRLIEECMLAANEAVAKFFQDEELPSVYRFHGEPDEQKLASFATLAQAYGFKLRMDDGLSSKDLNAFVSQLEGHPEQRALNQLLLRSMMQAVYSSTQVGHYGLAAEHYLHFTSPIRRYPDLLVHRLLKAHWVRRGKQRSAVMVEREEERLEAMAEQSSERERAAMLVEREVISFYATLLMKDRVGEEFDATVSSVTDFGFFVELDTEHVEGLVKTDALGFGGRLDKLLHALVYPDGRRIRVGQKCRVRLVSVSTERRQMDFEPLELDSQPVTRPEPRPRRPWEREELPHVAEPPRHRRFVREGQREEAAPSRFEKRRPTPREAPRSPAAEEPRRRRFVVRPALAPETPPEAEAPSRWQPPAREPDEGASGPDAPAKSPHPGFDRIRALAAQSHRAAQSPRMAPAHPREEPSPEHWAQRSARKAAPSGKKTQRSEAPAGKRKGAPGGGKPSAPKARGKFKPGRRSR
ncbi:RNAse R [Stigmatella aurantiaca]|uniref:Ribonuclease R n=1 Tax=Stigmatella aurantiaca TaxID=41 RepID=A0A1H7N9V8_STIAU|nr:ribonuclease R [Stigmatella aurantiaca]SEL20254.1 RNAse R [Stigmatella aurantiaca]